MVYIIFHGYTCSYNRPKKEVLEKTRDSFKTFLVQFGGFSILLFSPTSLDLLTHSLL